MPEHFHQSRRDFLGSIGIGLGVSSIDLSKNPTDLYRTPPPAAPTTVLPLHDDSNCWAFQNNWIVHHFGFRTEGDEGPTALERVRSAASYSFTLDGTEVTDFHRGWTDIEETTDGQYVRHWSYSIPPLQATDHTFELEMRFNTPVRTQGNPSRLWEGTYRFEGSYVVVPRPTQNRDSERTGRNPRTSLQEGEIVLY